MPLLDRLLRDFEPTLKLPVPLTLPVILVLLPTLLRPLEDPLLLPPEPGQGGQGGHGGQSAGLSSIAVKSVSIPSHLGKKTFISS